MADSTKQRKKTPEEITEESRNFPGIRSASGEEMPEEEGLEEGDLYFDYIAPITGGIRAALAKGGRGLLNEIVERKRKMTPEEAARAEAARVRDEARIQQTYEGGGRMSQGIYDTPRNIKIDWHRLRSRKPD